MNTFEAQQRYKLMAMKVIRQAMDDFRGLGLGQSRTKPKHLYGVRSRIYVLRDQLHRLRVRIDAGTFLFERNDQMVRLWFGWMDCTPEAFRSRVPRHMKLRLSRLKIDERDVVKKLNEATAVERSLFDELEAMRERKQVPA